MKPQHNAGGWPAWWLRRGAPAWALLPLAGLFGAAAALRRGAYALGLARIWRAPVPVIVVGNVTVGGAGKTPLVLAVAAALRAAGRHPGIVARGYRRDAAASEPMAVLPQSDARAVGDEPLLLRRLADCPVWVGRRRALAAAALLRAHPEVDVLISDDGLQHLALARDLELVAVDRRRAGNGWLLPAGPLRERWNRRRDATLGPADALGGIAGPCFATTRTAGPLRHLATGERLAPDEFARRHAGRPLAAAAGIGEPAQFFDMLGAAGLPLAHTLPLPDHAAFDADTFAPFAPVGAAAILLTEKDAVKCAPTLDGFERLWAVELRLDIDGAFFSWLRARLSALSRPSDGLSPA